MSRELPPTILRKQRTIHKPPTSTELLISFSDEDAAIPKNWPSSRKWLVTGVLSLTCFNRIMVSTMMAPALTVLMDEFDMGSAEANMSLLVYLLATAFGPMVCDTIPQYVHVSRFADCTRVTS